MKRNIDIGHNMKHLFQVLFLLLFCYACSSSEKQQQPKDFIEINMVPLIEGEAKKMPLQEWAKSVRFIPLETNEDILIKHIEDVFQHGDTLLVRHWERLSAFDMNGKYLYDIWPTYSGATSTYRGCTKLTDYADMPATWK